MVIAELDTQRMQAVVMQFLKQVNGCSFRYQIMNEDIRAELGICCMNDRLRQYSLQWKQHRERD